MANKSAVLSVKIVGDSRNLQGALRRASKSVSEEMDRISNASKKINGAIGGMVRLGATFTAVGLASAGLLAGAANVFALASSLASLVGILPVLPGLLAGFAAGGLVTYFAMKDLTHVFNDLLPLVDELKKAVNANLFAEAEAPIRSLVDKVFPSFKKGLAETGTAVGKFFGELAYQIERRWDPEIMAYAFKPLNESINIATKAMGPLVEAFTTLGLTGGQYLPRLAEWFVNLSERFNDFIQKADANGDLERWIDNAIAGFIDLGRIIGGISEIMGGLGKAAGMNGGASLDSLANALERVADVVNGPAFQKIAGGLFDSAEKSLQNLGVAAGPLGGAFEVLSGPLGRVMEMLGYIAGQALTALAAVIVANEPLINDITAAFEMFGVALGVAFTWIKDNPEAFTALAIGIGVLVGAIKLATTAMTIFNLVMLLNPMVLVAVVVVALIAVIIYLATQTQFFQTVWAAVCKFAADVWKNMSDGVRNALKAAIDFVIGIIRAFPGTINGFIQLAKNHFTNAFETMQERARGIINNIVGFFGGIVSAVSRAMTWVRNLFNMGGMPGWLKSVLGRGGTGLEITSTFLTGMAVPGQLGIGATGIGMPSYSSSSRSTEPAVEQTIINITVNGALDSQSVSEQVYNLYQRHLKNTGQRAVVSIS